MFKDWTGPKPHYDNHVINDQYASMLHFGNIVNRAVQVGKEGAMCIFSCGYSRRGHYYYGCDSGNFSTIYSSSLLFIQI